MITAVYNRFESWHSQFSSNSSCQFWWPSYLICCGKQKELRYPYKGGCKNSYIPGHARVLPTCEFQVNNRDSKKIAARAHRVFASYSHLTWFSHHFCKCIHWFLLITEKNFQCCSAEYRFSCTARCSQSSRVLAAGFSLRSTSIWFSTCTKQSNY